MNSVMNEIIKRYKAVNWYVKGPSSYVYWEIYDFVLFQVKVSI